MFVFGDVQLDVGRRELHLRGQLADLQPLAFDLLGYFVANAGRAISKDELLAKVWGDVAGTDAMIARAVMKVRRAIGDDGQEPRFLKTIHRVGYRLDVEVSKRPRKADPLPQAKIHAEDLERVARPKVLLPCVNRTGEASLDWVESGVPSLVEQLGNQSGRLTLSPTDWASSTETPGDPFSSACDALGAPEAVRFELLRSGGALRLDVMSGRTQSDAQKTSFEGENVCELAHAFAESLSEAGGSHAAVSTSPHQFWEEQLAQALDLERRGAVDRALALMDECIERLPATPQRLLAHAALLRKGGRHDDAGKQAQAALDLEGQGLPSHLRARALFELATQAWHLMKPEETSRLLEHALAAAQQDAAGTILIPDVLSFYASIAREREGPAAGVRIAERAIAAAVALGNKAKEAHARVVLGSVLVHTGQTHRASDVLRRAADIAHRQRLVIVEAYALRMLALLDVQVGRYSVAIDEAQRAAALAASCGHLNMRDSARAEEVVSLVHLGRLAEAQSLAERLQTTVDSAWENAYSLRYGRALLAWRSGAGRVGTEQMKAVADEGRDVGLRFSAVARLEECLQLVSLGDLLRAQDAVAELERSGSTVSSLHGTAAICLARGDRRACIDALRKAAAASVLDSAGSLQIDISLAWLLLEDGQLEEASALVGSVAESESDLLAARILNAGYLLATNPNALADGEWETLVTVSPRMISLCPWLLDTDVRERLGAGTLRPLPELLARVCW